MENCINDRKDNQNIIIISRPIESIRTGKHRIDNCQFLGS